MRRSLFNPPDRRFTRQEMPSVRLGGHLAMDMRHPWRRVASHQEQRFDARILLDLPSKPFRHRNLASAVKEREVYPG